MKLLNLGCGLRIHSAWTNIDFKSTGPGVIAANLREGIPFPEASFDVVYHSHVLEHFSKNDAESFISECYRVLEPGGVLRIAIPDLEQIVLAYLTALEKARQELPGWSANYDWILLEMYDQTVRNKPGGGMLTFLRNVDFQNKEYVLRRCGLEVEGLLGSIAVASAHQKRSLFKRSFGRLSQLYHKPSLIREVFLRLILGKEFRVLQLGRFREAGEIHQWMYDEFSLSRLLKKTGFIDPVRRIATESYLAHWADFNLDTEPDGSVYKPDSLFLKQKNQNKAGQL